MRMTIGWPNWEWAILGFVVLVVLWGSIVQARSQRRRDGAKVVDYMIHVDLDVLRQIESGGNPLAVSPAGARGPYQLTRAAWSDAIEAVKRRNPQYGSLGYEAWVTDEIVSRCIAWLYLSDCLPRYLTAARLSDDDRTSPVPDTLDARLAAWNAGALRVRRAYGKSRANWEAHLPAETREFLSRYHREVQRRVELQTLEKQTSNIKHPK